MCYRVGHGLMRLRYHNDSFINRDRPFSVGSRCDGAVLLDGVDVDKVVPRNAHGPPEHILGPEIP